MQVKWSIFIALGLAVIMGLSVQLMRYEYVMMRKNVEQEFLSFDQLPVKHALPMNEKIVDSKEKYLVLYDSRDPVSVRFKKNSENVFEYLKKNVVYVEVDSFQASDLQYNMVLITFEDLGKISHIEALLHYVSQGGNVFFTTRPMMDSVFGSIYRMLGIAETGDELTTTGITLVSNVLLRNDGLHMPGDVVSNSSINISLDPQARLLAKTDENIPLLWDYSYKKGKFMVFNGSILHLKESRGLLTGALSMLPDYFVYPILNFKLMYIDDFPAFYSDAVDENIFRIYGLNKTKFFRNVWWPDMLRFVDEYRLRFTGALIQTYNNTVEPPFTEDEGSDQDILILYGKELMNHGGELGIHGYNHQPLTMDRKITGFFNYNTWKSTEDMVLSLREVHRYSQTAFPAYKYANYVPPSNVLSEEGRTAIKTALPDITSISSLYLDDPFHRSYTQEFEVAEDGLIELPRITSGYVPEPYVRWSYLNGINSLGVFSHFIHPDDVLDKKRSGDRNWDNLREEFESILKEVEDKYPWLRMLTASEAVLEIQKYRSTSLYFEEKENGLIGYCNDFRGDIYLVLRTESKITGTVDCQIQQIDEGAYLIKVEREKFEVNWEGL